MGRRKRALPWVLVLLAAVAAYLVMKCGYELATPRAAPSRCMSTAAAGRRTERMRALKSAI